MNIVADLNALPIGIPNSVIEDPGYYAHIAKVLASSGLEYSPQLHGINVVGNFEDIMKAVHTIQTKLHESGFDDIIMFLRVHSVKHQQNVTYKSVMTLMHESVEKGQQQAGTKGVFQGSTVSTMQKSTTA